MKFNVFHHWSELPNSAEKLFYEATKNSVFLSREWFESLTSQIINDKQQLLLACVIADDAVLAVLPLLTNENREWTSFTHPYSALFSILLASHQQSESLKCLCQGLKSLEFDYLSLAPVASDDNNLSQFQDAIKVCGLDCYTSHKTYNWFRSVSENETFSEYMAERPSKLRNTVTRKQRKLKREHDYTIQLYIDDSIDQALDHYHELYKVSWKANEQQEALVKDVVTQFSKRAWPRLAILYINNKPIAAQLWFVVENKASIFRLVYDEKWKNYSPGSILMAYLFEHVFENDNVIEVDFLSGNDTYKKDWMSERRERVSLVCVNNNREEGKKTKGFIKKWGGVFFK